jgi:hypothetical protein
MCKLVLLLLAVVNLLMHVIKAAAANRRVVCTVCRKGVCMAAVLCSVATAC